MSEFYNKLLNLFKILLFIIIYNENCAIIFVKKKYKLIMLKNITFILKKSLKLQGFEFASNSRRTKKAACALVRSATPLL